MPFTQSPFFNSSFFIDAFFRKNLTNLSFIEEPTTDEGDEDIVDLEEKSNQLDTFFCIDLHDAPEDRTKFVQALESLYTFKTLVGLDLRTNAIDHSEIKSLQEIFRNNLYLKNLALTDNNIGDMGIEELLMPHQGESFLQNITHLFLEENNITSLGAKKIGEFILKYNALSFINISYNDINDVGVNALLSPLSQYDFVSNLKHLSLKSTHITSTGARIIRDFITKNNSLEILNLENNELGNEGLKHILEGLKNNTKITKLYYNKKDKDPDIIDAITRELKTNIFLTKILQPFSNETQTANITSSFTPTSHGEKSDYTKLIDNFVCIYTHLTKHASRNLPYTLMISIEKLVLKSVPTIFGKTKSFTENETDILMEKLVSSIEKGLDKVQQKKIAEDTINSNVPLTQTLKRKQSWGDFVSDEQRDKKFTSV